MTNCEILRIAMEQSAADSGCAAEDFTLSANKVVISSVNPQARAYLELPFFCDLTSYGSNIVASVSPEIAEDTKRYLDRYETAHCFETPNLYVLNDILKKYGMCICFMAEYFLPDTELLKPLVCGYETRLLKPEDFAAYYLPEWRNALCEKRRHLDRLALGAFDNGKLVGLAGCSADCRTMWQIGVDVLPEYRRQTIASALTSGLAAEILKREIVPFYCCAWSNIRSARNARRSGFKPAWVQITARSIDFTAELNR